MRFVWGIDFIWAVAPSVNEKAIYCGLFSFLFEAVKCITLDLPLRYTLFFISSTLLSF